MTRKLTLDDIADLRAYERERADFRDRIIALKQDRRVSVGPLVTLVFENRDTIRFQIQEMARVERLLSDDAIEAELRVYNPLIPDPGHLSATLFVELTSRAELETWLPRLVGIERAVAFRLDGGNRVIAADPDPEHARQLTREDVTASVHYVRWTFDAAAVAAFRQGAVDLVVDHPAYQHEVRLAPATVKSLLTDLEGP